MGATHFWWLRHADGLVLEVSTNGGEMQRATAARVVEGLEPVAEAPAQPALPPGLRFRPPTGWVAQWAPRLGRLHLYLTPQHPIDEYVSAVRLELMSRSGNTIEPYAPLEATARCDRVVEVPAVCRGAVEGLTEPAYVLLQPCGPGADEALFAVLESLELEGCRIQSAETEDDACLLWVLAATLLALGRARRRRA